MRKRRMVPNSAVADRPPTPLPRQNRHPACRYFFLQVGKQGVRGVMFCLVYPMAGSPFWTLCWLLPTQATPRPFPSTVRKGSRNMTSKRVNPPPRHLHALSHTKMGEHVAHWRLMNPPPRMDITLSYPQPKKTCEFHSFVQHNVTPDCCVSPDVPKSGGGGFVPPLEAPGLGMGRKGV